MSNVLIKGMEMPENCYDCKFECENLCCVIGRRTESLDRPEWCPLVEVSTPHGDLIDRNEVYDSILNGMVMTGYQSAALDCIKEYAVPTVIEGEGRENDDN